MIRFFSFLLLLTLAACGGAPSAQVTVFTPPDLPGGRMCVDQCAKSKDYCEQGCGLDYRGCYNDVQAMAQTQYDNYVRDHFGDPQKSSVLPSDFEHPDACNAEKKRCLADCARPYKTCYTACGGAVSTTSSCQFLCFE